MGMKKIFLLPLAFLCFGFVSQISAQVYLPPPPPVLDSSKLIWNTYVTGQMGNNIAAQMARQNAAVSKQQKKSSAVKPAPVSASKTTAFSRAAVFVLPKKLAQNSGANNSKTDADQVNTLLQNLWQRYETSFSAANRELKMPYNDVATAMSYYIILNYLQANNVVTVEAEKTAAVYRQISALLGQNPDFTKLRDEDKQLFAEVLVMMGGVPTLIFETKRNPAETRQAARENLERLFGDKTTTMKITENGVEF